MSLLISTDKCTGCFACAVACPQKAIGIKQDELGSLYPEIDRKRCINCGKCQKVCPEQRMLPDGEPQKAYAVWSLDAQNRQSSASGGAAAEFYAEAITQGYWICGAEYTAEGRVVHTLSREMDAIQRYKQSKYVYSEVSVVYETIKQLLDQREKVLMISLPCKIAGLLAYLGKEYSNLLLVDIVCHGTPSAELLQRHIAEVARGSANYNLRFRQDNQFLVSIESNGRIVYEKVGKEDTYLAAFLEGLSYRDSCYQCRYAKHQRISDITICDFWGIGQEVPFDHPYSGSISAVLVNTDKGAWFFETCRRRLFVEERPVSEAIRGNAQLNAPVQVHPKREEFVKGCASVGFERTVSLLLKKEIQMARRENKIRKLKELIRRTVGVFVKRYRG